MVKPMSENDLHVIQATRTFSGTAAQCGQMRAWIRSLMRPFPQIRDAVELVATELFTNAVEHTASGKPGGRVEVFLTRLAEDPQTLCLEIVDQGTGGDLPRQVARAILPGPEAQSGRGLFITSVLSREWGRFPAGNGHSPRASQQRGERPGSMVTWAEFNVHQNAENTELAGSH